MFVCKYLYKIFATDNGGRETETFEVSVELHQGSALSPFLFVMVMDVLSEEIRNKELWELLYADDLVITADSEKDLPRRVGEW